MAPRKKRSIETSSTSTLALTPLHEKFQSLQSDHQWLLKQIRKKRTELDNFINEMRTLINSVFAQGSETYKKLQEVDDAIHEIFQKILANQAKKKLNKRDLQKVKNIYLSLQLQQVISVKSFETVEEISDEPVEFTEETFPPEEELSAPTTTPEENHPHLRQTFLRLASVYHPDRASDEETHSQNTEIMKEINRAYKAGDFARLLELETQLEKQEESIENIASSGDDLERECDRLSRENDTLRQQYEGIKKELRSLRNDTQEGMMVKAYRQANRSGMDFIAMLLSDLENEVNSLKGIRDFVLRFYEGDMTIKEFLAGPSREITLEDVLKRIAMDISDISLDFN